MIKNVIFLSLLCCFVRYCLAAGGNVNQLPVNPINYLSERHCYNFSGIVTLTLTSENINNMQELCVYVPFVLVSNAWFPALTEGQGES